MTERKEAVAEMEACLSKVGLGGGTVVLTRDARLSGANSDIPSKLSFNGAKCKKMFKKGSSERFDTVWKEICEAERNTTNRGQGKEDRQKMGAAFEKLQVYFTCLNLSPRQRREYKATLEKWGKAYVKAFGEGVVTHYVVSTYYTLS